MEVSYETLSVLASHGDKAADQAGAAWLKSGQFTIVVYNPDEDSYDLINKVSQTRFRQYLCAPMMSQKWIDNISRQNNGL